MRRILMAAAFLLVALAPSVTAAPAAHHDQPQAHLPEGCLYDRTQANGWEVWLCPPPAEATATTAPSATATATTEPSPTHDPTATTEPTGVPTTEPTPGGDIAPFAGAPLCPTHNNRAYHGLWNAVAGCHYDHHHGDNPHALDYRQGGDEIYRLMGSDLDSGYAEISYPWMTASTDSEGTVHQENDVKHAGYGWHVYDNLPCVTTGLQPLQTGSPCITAFRYHVHQHSYLDAHVRYHSYVAEWWTSDGGHALIGGHMDCGDLHVPEGNIVIDVPGNVDSERNPNGAGRHKQHTESGTPQIIWYCASQRVIDRNYPRGFATISVSIHDVFNYTSAANPFAPGPRVPDPRANATNYRTHLAGLEMVDMFNALLDADGDRQINWRGFADRYGRPQAGGCTEYSPDCAPMLFENLRSGYAYQASPAHTANVRHEHDIFFNGQTSGWSQPVP